MNKPVNYWEGRENHFSKLWNISIFCTSTAVSRGCGLSRLAIIWVLGSSVGITLSRWTAVSAATQLSPPSLRHVNLADKQDEWEVINQKILNSRKLLKNIRWVSPFRHLRFIHPWKRHFNQTKKHLNILN